MRHTKPRPSTRTGVATDYGQFALITITVTTTTTTTTVGCMSMSFAVWYISNLVSPRHAVRRSRSQMITDLNRICQVMLAMIGDTPPTLVGREHSRLGLKPAALYSLAMVSIPTMERIDLLIFTS